MASTFRLEIVTPAGLVFDDQVESLIVRTSEGDTGILKGHVDYMAAIEVGEVKLKMAGGERKIAATAEGFVHVAGDHARVLVSSFEWAENIDTEKAQQDKEKATALLAAAKTSDETELAKFMLRKARVRLRVGNK